MKSVWSLCSFAITIMVLFILVAATSWCDDRVQPQTLSGVRLVRDASTVAYTTNIYYVTGASLLFTNMICCANSSGTVRQGLDNVTVEVGVGNSTTSVWYQGSVLVATSGTWTASVTLPEFTAIYWQCRLTDSLTNVYYYGQQILNGTPHL